ncbi:hypothetical protein ABBQ32_010520 [Trebouxia sp. C0010 RCD-2024]
MPARKLQPSQFLAQNMHLETLEPKSAWRLTDGKSKAPKTLFAQNALTSSMWRHGTASSPRQRSTGPGLAILALARLVALDGALPVSGSAVHAVGISKRPQHKVVHVSLTGLMLDRAVQLLLHCGAVEAALVQLWPEHMTDRGSSRHLVGGQRTWAVVCQLWCAPQSLIRVGLLGLLKGLTGYPLAEQSVILGPGAGDLSSNVPVAAELLGDTGLCYTHHEASTGSRHMLRQDASRLGGHMRWFKTGRPTSVTLPTAGHENSKPQEAVLPPIFNTIVDTLVVEPCQMQLTLSSD